jgi:hypothetical protein
MQLHVLFLATFFLFSLKFCAAHQISQRLVIFLFCMKVHILTNSFLVHNIRAFTAYLTFLVHNIRALTAYFSHLVRFLHYLVINAQNLLLGLCH